MAEESSTQERTEEATPQHLKRARQDGKVALSRDTGAAASLLAALGAVYYLVARADRIGSLMRTALGRATRNPSAADAADALGSAARELAGLLAVPLVAIAGAALAATFFQVGPLLTGKPLKPKLERLNPAAGLKRMFLTGRTWVELARGTVKVLILGTVCYAVTRADLPSVLRTPLGRPGQIAQVLWSCALGCFKAALLCAAGLAAMDLLLQRWRHRLDMRMTKDQARRDHKQEEGDPEYKAARKRQHEEIALGEMLAAAEGADVMVLNPTHLACALRYDPKREQAPRLLAKGQGHIAQRLRQIARQKGIATLRDVPLARSLYRLRLNTLIPVELYEAAAEVLRWVEETEKAHGRIPAWAQPATGGKDEI